MDGWSAGASRAVEPAVVAVAEEAVGLGCSSSSSSFTPASAAQAVVLLFTVLTTLLHCC